MCTFISNCLNFLIFQLVRPTQSLTFSMIQVYCVNRFPNRLMTGFCGDKRCLIGASFSIILYISDLWYVFVFFEITLNSDLSLIVGHPRILPLSLEFQCLGVAVCSSLPWGLVTLRETVEENSQLAIYKVTRLVYCIASLHEPCQDQMYTGWLRSLKTGTKFH